jgi:hypothetical protein
MASLLTLPTYEMNSIITGDLDILNALDVSNGTGTVYVRNGGLYVEGLTDLDQTTITTTDGKFHVLGSNKIEFGVTSSIELTAQTTSFFTTTAGVLSLNATATDANGKISILAAGTGANSILLDAQNTTSGQITIQSAGADTATDAVKILATNATDGNILIQGSGNFASSNPAIKLFADNVTSGQILLTSAGGSVTSDAIKLIATDTTDGNVLIQGSGNFASSNPAVKIYANNATSGQILLDSAGGAAASDAIKLLASDTTEGNILIQGNGVNTNAPAIKIFADNNTSGQVVVQADGAIASAIRILATDAVSGGIDIDAIGGAISIDTQNVVTGITIGTATSGVPVTIGTASSLTTIAGDLVIGGTTTMINTETLLVEDNIILLNSGNGELDIDSGIVIRRYQTPNDLATGNVTTGPNPIQESGAFQAGSSTPNTLVLGLNASATDDFYNGQWIRITSGTGIDQVRRIKDYVGSTKTATLYVTADNTASFTDGLDLTTAPAATNTYSLYSDGYSMSFFDESLNAWTFANTSLTPDAISEVGASTATIKQYQEINTGAVDVYPQVYHNVLGSASTTTITFTSLLGHGFLVGDTIQVSDSLDFTPALPNGLYVVQTVPTANSFTITVPASTVSIATSTATITDTLSSSINVNAILPHTPGFGLNIPGLSVYEDITIPKTSTAYFFLNLTTNLYGAYFISVADLNNTDGSFAVFVAARSTGGGGAINRQAVAAGNDGQRINADWVSGEKIKIRMQPAGIGAGSYVYRVRVFSAL